MEPIYFWSASKLRNGVEDWKKITPQPVQKAVDALRRRFAGQAHKIAYIMEHGCYPALRRGMADEQDDTISSFIRLLGFPALPSVDRGHPEPSVFKAYFYLCADLLAKEVGNTFCELLEISLAQSGLINGDPVEWARLETNVLVADESYKIALWTKNASDKQGHDPSDDPDEFFHWTKWRAPKWFFMHPFANLPYHRATAWERMDEADSTHLLRVAEDRFNLRLISALDKAVDESHVRLAKETVDEISAGNGERATAEPAMKDASQIRRISQAPSPPTSVGGLAIVRSVPKPTQIPPSFPLYYPNELKPRTEAVRAETVKKFPEQNQILALCKHFISEMTPLFCEAVRDGAMKAYEVLSENGMGGLIHSMLVYNDEGPHSGFSSLSDQGFRLEQEIRRSAEWLELAKEVADVPLTIKEQQNGDPSRDHAKILPFTPHMPLSNPLTANDAGSSVTIDVEAFVMALPGKNANICGGAITGLGYQTLYQVFFDDLYLAATRGDIVPAYIASVARVTAGIGGRFFIGSILTPAKGRQPTIGNYDGGTPHQVLKAKGESKIETTPGTSEGNPNSRTSRVRALHAATPGTPLLEAEEGQLARKLDYPSAYPTLSVKEAAAAFGKSQSTIYRWVDTGKLASSGVAGRIKTESVIRLLNSPKLDNR